MTTSTRYPTTNAVGSTGFTNANNAYATDNTYATAVPGTNSTISSYFGGFDFASYVPDGSTINSVHVYIERKMSTTASTASTVAQGYDGSTAIGSLEEDTSEPTSDTVWDVTISPTLAQVRSADFRILVGAKRGTGATGYTMSLDVVYVVVDYTAPSGVYTLTMGQGSFSLTGQATSLLANRKLTLGQGSFSLSGQAVSLLRSLLLVMGQGAYTLSGQEVGLIYTPAGHYTLTMEPGSLSLSGQAVSLLARRYLAIGLGEYIWKGVDTDLWVTRYLLIGQGDYALSGQDLAIIRSYFLSLATGVYNLTGQSITMNHILYEPEGDMITFGTLLSRIQSALGDTTGATWDRTTTLWDWAQDALRDFPILRPKTVLETVSTAGHSFTLPSDFRRVIYVEYPISQDPPDYLARKSHLDIDFYSNTGFYDVDRDYDEYGGYIMWISDDLAVGGEVMVRYLASHLAEFSSEATLITVENQYVQVLIYHVILMAFTERLATQLQDPTAHMDITRQMAEAVKAAETNYLHALEAATADVSSSQRVEGWKLDRFDRIY